MPLTTDDVLAIQQLYARYNHAIDSGDADGWAACFTPDGTFSSASGNFAGTQQLADFARAFASRLKARHWTNNLVIDGSGGEATGTCYLMLLRLVGEGQPPAILTTGIYRDAIVRHGGAWKFAARNVASDA
jgi:ketosteroid isomerase-like protein